MRLALPLTAALVAALAIAGAGCGSDDTSPESASSTTVVSSEVTTSSVPETTTTTTLGAVTMAGQTVPVARLLAVAAALCEAAAQAPTDVEAAEKTFNGRAHDGLHLIARGLEQIDRAASAALLEAKQKVEGDFSRSAAGSQVAADLKPLHDVTVSSLARFNVTAGACPPAA